MDGTDKIFVDFFPSGVYARADEWLFFSQEFDLILKAYKDCPEDTYIIYVSSAGDKCYAGLFKQEGRRFKIFNKGREWIDMKRNGDCYLVSEVLGNFLCPNCGGRVFFGVGRGRLVVSYCSACNIGLAYHTSRVNEAQTNPFVDSRWLSIQEKYKKYPQVFMEKLQGVTPSVEYF